MPDEPGSYNISIPVAGRVLIFPFCALLFSVGVPLCPRRLHSRVSPGFRAFRFSKLIDFDPFFHFSFFFVLFAIFIFTLRIYMFPEGLHVSHQTLVLIFYSFSS